MSVIRVLVNDKAMNWLLEDTHNFHFQVSDIWVPSELEISNGQLLYDPGQILKGRKVKPKRNLLNDFIRIAEAAPANVLKFACKWGILGLCRHKMPASHAPDWWVQNMSSKEKVDGCELLGTESIAVWQEWAEEALAILNVSARLHQEERGSEKDWMILFRRLGLSEKSYKPLPKRTLQQEQATLSGIVNKWIIIGRVKPFLSWNERGKQPQISFFNPSYTSLFGALAVQLMAAVSRADSPVICASCGAPYFPRRRPRAGERHYCERCGRKAAVRDAARRFRERARG